MSKLPAIHDPEIIREIVRCDTIYRRLRLRALPDTQTTIAAEFGVTQSYISKLIYGAAQPSGNITADDVRTMRHRVRRAARLLDRAKQFGRSSVSRRLGISGATHSFILKQNRSTVPEYAPRPRPAKADPVRSFLTGKPGGQRHAETV